MHELLKRLMEERGRHIAAMRSVVDSAEAEKREMTAEESESFTRANSEIDAVDARIDEVKRAIEREAAHDEARAGLEAIVRPRDPQAEAREAGARDVRAFLRGEAGRSFELRATGPGAFREARALVSNTAGAGGNTVQTSFYNRLMAHLIEVSGVLMASPTVLNTDSGEPLQIPKTTAHSTATLVAQGATIPTSEPAFGQVTLGSYKYGELMQVARELIDDTSVDLEGYLAMQAGRATGNAFGGHAITGTGTGQPTGLITGATVGVTGGTGVAGGFTSDNLIDLYFSVIAPYRNSPSCAWLMKDSTLATVRKFKGSDGQYIWQPSYQVGAPDTILGKPVFTDPFVPGVALNAKSVVFGDMSQYFVRMVNGVRFERSDDFAFNSDLVTYRCLLRADGVLVDLTGAVKVFQGAAS
jgi:HK97 family phage major capsid protein